MSKSADEFKIEVFRTLEQVRSIRLIWQRLLSDESTVTVNADIDRYISVILLSGNTSEPYTFLLRHDGIPIALVACRIEKHRMCAAIGYNVVYKPFLKCLTVVYGGVMGKIDNLAASEIARHLMLMLNKGEAELVWFSHLRTDSVLYEVVRKTPCFLCRGHLPIIQNHWLMSVPDNMELFYQSCSKKHRGNSKRYLRKIENDYPLQVKLRTYMRAEDIEHAVGEAAMISSQTYQNAINKGLVLNDSTISLMILAAKQGLLRLDILYVKAEPCAFQVGFKYRGRYFLDQIGYSPGWRGYNIGTVLFLKVLEELCADLDVDYIDFGFGDAEYKQIYGNHKWQEASLYIFASRPYPIFVNIMTSLITWVSLLAEVVLDKTGIRKWIKKKWRERLEKHQG